MNSRRKGGGVSSSSFLARLHLGLTHSSRRLTSGGRVGEETFKALGNLEGTHLHLHTRHSEGGCISGSMPDQARLGRSALPSPYTSSNACVYDPGCRLWPRPGQPSTLTFPVFEAS